MFDTAGSVFIYFFMGKTFVTFIPLLRMSESASKYGDQLYELYTVEKKP